MVGMRCLTDGRGAHESLTESPEKNCAEGCVYVAAKADFCEEESSYAM